MDTIVAIAIVGTGQQSSRDLSTETTIDQLARQLPDSDLENKLLLIAGSLATYQRAGYSARQAPARLQPAPPEQWATCTPSIALLLEKLLGRGHADMLPEALELMKRARQRLPYSLLPEALDYGARNKELRQALILVLGERGRWLSHYNPAWSWVTQFLTENEGVEIDEVESIWQEGTAGQRQELLRRLCTIDPAQARERLLAVWKQEKAQTRAELLSTFKYGLTNADEPLLENALNDRSEAVRTVAASLLVCLPTSALIQRMIVRADAMLSYTEGKLLVTLPTEVDSAWQRDSSIISLVQPLEGEALSPLQAIAFIPPSYWEKHFSLSVTALIKAAENTEHTSSLISLWSAATLRYHETQWFAPLWDWKAESNISPIQQELIKHMPPQEAEARIIPLLTKANILVESTWLHAIGKLPRPWSKVFGEAYLQALRTIISSPQDVNNHNHILTAITTAAIALPSTCFEAAMEPWPIDENIGWQSHYRQQQIENFIETIRMRKQLMEEIRLNDNDK